MSKLTAYTENTNPQPTDLLMLVDDPSGSALTQKITVNNIRGGVYSVMDYGAAADGSTDDTTAINNAITATPTGGVLLFPVGTYRITSAISITKQITIIGQGYNSAIFIDGAINGFAYDGSGISGGLQGCILRDMSFQGNAGTLNAIWMRRCHRNRIENITIPSIGNAGLYLYGSILNTFQNVTVSVNLPSITGTPVNPTYGVQMVNDGGMTANANTFINLIVEGITTAPGIGVAIPDGGVSNIFIGGTSEGNTIGIQLGSSTGAGTTNNVFLAFHTEENGSNWDSKYASTQPDYNVVLGQYQQPPGITNYNYVYNQTINDGATNAPAIRFLGDLDTGIYRSGTGTLGFIHSGAVKFGVGATYNVSYSTFLPGANDSLDLGDITAGLRWRHLNLTQQLSADRLQIAVRTSAPSSPANGMIAYADGTSWNPGSGAGFYGYQAGAWVKL